MRAIEFRAWYIDEEVMAYSDDDAEFDVAYWDGANCSRIEMINYLCKPLNMILMQYTGLKDAEGNKVYEGDILNVDNSNALVEVVWIDDGWCVYDENLNVEPWLEKDYEPLSPYSRSSIIIGNIYENKELLNEQKTTHIGTDRDG